ncbi:MAG: carboxypeptidase-like regulatory domain-containing protein [Verrucomicrobiota bacterium]|nr:carboxypeptidase-like regulatory domain-containing protein [Verrucomicrobiota bacterium]
MIAASLGSGAVPAVNVSVSDASGNAAYKGTTNASGTFGTAKLKPGNYVVQFNSNSAELKGNKYAVVVSAGKKKVAADVAGEKFAGGGVAMKVDVAAGSNITGQVAAQTEPLSKNGKKMVWIPPPLGSNMPGHWAEEDSAEAKLSKSRGVISKEKVQQMQDKGYNPPGN